MSKAKKDYLKQIENMDLYIQQLISEVEELRSLSQSVSSVQYGEQHIKSGSQKNEAPFVNYLFKINELEITSTPCDSIHSTPSSQKSSSTGVSLAPASVLLK